MPNDAEQAKTLKELRAADRKGQGNRIPCRQLAKEPEVEKRVDPGETNELRAMLKKTSVVQFIDDFLGNGSTDNRKLIDEVRSGTGVGAGYVPVDLLFTEQRVNKTDGEEDRLTSAPTATPTTERPFLPYLFPEIWSRVPGRSQ